MPEALSRILAQLRESWKKLPRQAQIVIPIVAVVIMGALITMSFWSGGEAESLLFSNLSSRNLNLIQAELGQLGIKYRVESDGLIYVPTTLESQARLALAMKNLPEGDAYDIFEKSNIGDTFLDFERKYQQTTEIKIRDAIESLEPVRFADVNITPMVDSPFAVDKKPAKAVVIVRLHAGRKLDYTQVQGITQLVSSSVKGLSPEDVKVINGKGYTLGTEPIISETDQKMEGALKRLEYEKVIATEKERKIQQYLGPLVGGEDYVKVVVHVEADFDDIKKHEITYNPNDLLLEEIPIESQISIDERTKGPANIGLPPGTASNVTTSANLNLQRSDLEVETKKMEINNLVSQLTVNTETTPGTIKRITATAMIDYKKEYQGGELQYVAWTPEEQVVLEQGVKDAVGFNAERGDSVSVVILPFDRTVQTQIEKQLAAAERQRLFIDIAKYAAIVAVGIILLLLLRSVFHTLRVGEKITLKERIEAGTERVPLAVGAAGQEADVEIPSTKMEAIEDEKTSALAVVEEDEATLSEAELQELVRLQEEILAFVQSDSESAALIISNWLAELPPLNK